MTRITPTSALTAAAFFVAFPAIAQVTPEQVWENWQAQTATSGFALTAGSAARVGDTLTLIDVRISGAQDDVRVDAPMGTVLMRDLGNGSVDVAMGTTYPIEMKIDESGRDPVEMTLNVDQPGLSMIASGGADNMRYDVSATQVKVSLGKLRVDGEDIPLNVEIALNGLAGHASVAGADARDVSAEMKAESLVTKIAARNPDGEGDLRFDITTNQFALDYTGVIVPGMTSGSNIVDALRDGLRFAGGYSMGGTTFDFAFNDRSDSAAANGSIGSSEVTFRLDKDNLDYGVSVKQLDMVVSGSEIPFPELRIVMGEYSMGLGLPVSPSEEPGDFRFLARLVDLVMPPEVWAIADPMGNLPHDPATLVIDAKGKLRMLIALMDPEQAANADIPGELHALDLAELRLSAVGAELTGNGAFTFDNNDLETFDGMPRPTGALDLRLVGGNALLDKLIAMGLVPQDEAMGARMMMGLFGRPGDGPDTLTSRIEVTPEGAVLANGQRIQ